MTPHLEALIHRHIQTGGYAGAAVVAARHGEVVLEHYAGQAAPNLPSGPQVLWPIASISKMYAVSAIMSLVEQGQLTLNLRVVDVLPEFSGDMREEVRLRHLLTHTSGLIYESPQMEARLIAQTPLEALIHEAYSAPLLFKPGSAVRYADYNTLIAGQVAATVMGKPLEVLVQEGVLTPMKLPNTFFPTPPHQDARVAMVRGVMAEGTSGAMYNSRYARALAHPAFAVTASAPDLLRFALHFAPQGPRIHAESTLQAMSRNQTGVLSGIHPSMRGYDETAPMPWGLGWALQTEYTPALFCELSSFSTFGHGGASGCQVMIDPQASIVLAVLSNSHLRLGREAWYRRLQSVVNRVYASLT
jgi:CubicO group peptidase (beta-lactamase class C family)